MKFCLLLLLLIACASERDSLSTSLMNAYGNPQHGWYRASGVMPKNPVAKDERSLANGAMLFKELCSVCHGESALGNGPNARSMHPSPANLRVAAAKESEGHIYLQISHGREGMPMGSRTLAERDRWDIVNYLTSLSRSE
jgi:mono/diheme cytochrome c family protein